MTASKSTRRRGPPPATVPDGCAAFALAWQGPSRSPPRGDRNATAAGAASDDPVDRVRLGPGPCPATIPQPANCGTPPSARMSPAFVVPRVRHSRLSARALACLLRTKSDHVPRSARVAAFVPFGESRVEPCCRLEAVSSPGLSGRVGADVPGRPGCRSRRSSHGEKASWPPTRQPHRRTNAKLLRPVEPATHRSE
jgi:hypothetical protein